MSRNSTPSASRVPLGSTTPIRPAHAVAYADLAPGARDVTLVVGALADEPKASSLLTGLGYAEVRRFVSMEISFDRRPQPPAPVAGVELRELRSGEERAVHRC